MEKDFFLKMNIGRQAHYTWRHGVHLVKIESSRFDYDLYQLDRFFVEVVYNIELGQVERIEGFSSKDKLIAYVESLDISEIIP